MSSDILTPIPCNINNDSKPYKSLEDIPEIILGAGVFNYQYNEKPEDLGAEKILSRAFDLGIRALGKSLKNIKNYILVM